MTKELLALTLAEGVGPVTAKNLVSFCKGAEEIFSMSRRELLRIPGVGESVVERIVANKAALFAAAEKELEFCKKNDVRIIPYYDAAYPQDLKMLASAPTLLFVKGKADLNRASMAIVGTRGPTEYGKKQARRFASHWASRGLTIVSGLAFGIDAEAHTAALEAGGATVAVLGHGLATLYPKEHKSLAARIVENGALVSEYPSDYKPDPRHFPHRNRIVAGMSRAVLVVEAGAQSGALNTAGHALSLRKRVFAVPGPLGAKASEGTNALIRDGAAELATDPEFVLSKIFQYEMDFAPERTTGVSNPVPDEPPVPLNEHERTVYELLKIKDCLLDELLEATGFSLTGLMSVLLSMEFNGVITQLPGRKFTLNK
ncbi:MAG: DNA-processing protein DprA [Bacteroidia bacterium]|nr:DNA-processing protein DprA [Bacteroidia bacterium]